MKYLIYALVDKVDNQVRYIGKSTSGLRRPNQHFSDWSINKTNPYKKYWLKKCKLENILPSIEIIEIIPDEVFTHQILEDAEEFYIQYFKRVGCRLVNAQNAGKGSPGRKLSCLSKQKMSDAKNKMYNKLKLQGVLLKAWNSTYTEINDTLHKKCYKCTELKILSEFYRVGKNKTPKAICKKCDNSLRSSNRRIANLHQTLSK